jgi:uncharacterized membrane protein YidH (DUF202 family)
MEPIQNPITNDLNSSFQNQIEFIRQRKENNRTKQNINIITGILAVMCMIVIVVLIVLLV